MKSVGQKIRLGLLVILLSIAYKASSQNCISCTEVINSDVSQEIHVTPNMKLCIAPGVNCNGTVYMEGGQLCNSGVIHELRLDQAVGIINNYGSIVAIDDYVGITKDFVINNFPGAEFTFDRTLYMEIEPGKALEFNMYNNSDLIFVEELSVNSGELRINNGLTWDGSPLMTEQAIVNMLIANFSYCSVKIKNTRTGVVNIGKDLNTMGMDVFSIENTGYFNVFNSFSLGSETNNTTILNNNTFFVGEHFTIDQDANVMIINNVFEYSTGLSSMTVGRSLTLNSVNHEIVNNALLSVDESLNLYAGTISNLSRIECAAFNINAGNFKNNGHTQVTGNFSNSGVVDLGMMSFLSVQNYVNNGRITSNNDAMELEDYAKILISGNSENNSHLYGKTLIDDLSLTSSGSNAGFGFDVVTNPSLMDGVKFGTKAGAGIGSPTIKDCSAKGKFYSVLNLVPTNQFICPGACVDITPSLYLLMNAGSPYSSYANVPLTNFLWQPGNITTQVLHVCPAQSTWYTFSTTHDGCVYSEVININVGNVQVNAGPDIYVHTSSQSAFNPQISGGTPNYSCVWTSDKNQSFISNNCNTTVPPAMTGNEKFTLTVTDANGCTGTDNVFVKWVPSQYAEPKRKHDSGHYNESSSLFYFKYEGEYLPGTLIYRLYDDNRNAISCSNMVKSLGDNRYVLDFTTCSSTISGGYYSLEITNEKNEVTYLKIRK